MSRNFFLFYDWLFILLQVSFLDAFRFSLYLVGVSFLLCYRQRQFCFVVSRKTAIKQGLN